MSEMFQIFSLLQTTTAISYIIEQSVDDSSVAPLCGLVGGDGFPLNCIGWDVVWWSFVKQMLRLESKSFNFPFRKYVSIIPFPFISMFSRLSMI